MCVNKYTLLSIITFICAFRFVFLEKLVGNTEHPTFQEGKKEDCYSEMFKTEGEYF